MRTKIPVEVFTGFAFGGIGIFILILVSDIMNRLNQNITHPNISTPFLIGVIVSCTGLILLSIGGLSMDIQKIKKGLEKT